MLNFALMISQQSRWSGKQQQYQLRNTPSIIPKVIKIMHKANKKWLNVGQRNIWLHQPWPIESQVNWGYVTHPRLHMEDNPQSKYSSKHQDIQVNSKTCRRSRGQHVISYIHHHQSQVKLLKCLTIRNRLKSHKGKSSSVVYLIILEVRKVKRLFSRISLESAIIDHDVHTLQWLTERCSNGKTLITSA